MRRGGVGSRALRLLGIGVALLWSGFPIFLIVASSFKPGTEIFAVPPELVFRPTFEHYIRLWQQWPAYFRDLANSLVITGGATLLTAVTASAAGYVYSRCRSGLLAGSAFFTRAASCGAPAMASSKCVPLRARSAIPTMPSAVGVT